MWRSWTALGLIACSAGGGPGGADPARLHKDDEVAPELTYGCADAECKVVWITVEPARDDVVWAIDGGEPVTADGVTVEASDAGVTVDAADPDGWTAQSRIQWGFDEATTNVVVLGFDGGSCGAFRISTLGGCFQGPSVRHDATRLQLGASTVLPPAIYTAATNSQVLGFGYGARWTTGSAGVLPTGVSSTAAWAGHTLWFALANGQSLDARTTHNGADVVGLPRASCIAGRPGLGTL